MRIRDWQDIVRDIVEDDNEPEAWHAVAGPRARGIGEDLYLAHPSSGVYMLKTYDKNPHERKGVGTHVARSLDDEIGSYLPDHGPERFAVQPRPTSKEDAQERAKRLDELLLDHRTSGASPDTFFDEVMEALDSPAFGPLTYSGRERPSSLDGLSGTFEEADALLNEELEDLIDDDGIGRGFG